MAIVLSDTLVDRLLSVIGAVFNDGRLEIRTGSQPASPNDQASGSLLCSIRVPAVPFIVSGGAATLAGEWYDTALMEGTAGWFRLYDTAGTRWLDGSISAGGGGGDMTLNTTAVESGKVVQVTAFTLTLDTP